MLVLALACACGLESDDDGHVADRSGNGPYPGEGDLTLYDGASAESEECVVYDLVGPGVRASGLEGAPTVIVLSGSSINDADGNTLCSIITHPSGAAKVHDDSGVTLFTVVGPWVFSGQIAIGGSWQQIRQTYASQLLYTFSGAQIFEGDPVAGQVLATADVHIANASSTRKIVLSSLVAGECGGLGLYAEEDE